MRKWKSMNRMLVTWPRWPPWPYMVKTLQKSPSPEPMDRFPRNLVCSIWDPPAHHSFFKWWPWVDLEIFYGKVKFGNLGFFIGKNENIEFSETIATCDLKVCRCRQLIELMKVRKVKAISWPCPQDIYIWKSKLVFFRNYLAIFNQILYVSFQVQGNENPYTWCWSHDQDGHHTLLWLKPLKNLLL